MAYEQYYGGGTLHSGIWIDTRVGILYIQKSVKCLFDTCTILYDKENKLLKIQNNGNVHISRKTPSNASTIAIKKINKYFNIWDDNIVKDLKIVTKNKDYIELEI